MLFWKWQYLWLTSEILHRVVSLNTNKYKSWKIWFVCVISLCFYPPLENELWFHPLEYSAGKAQEWSSSILKSNKSVTSMKHRSNTSKEKSVLWWKTYLIFFFPNTTHTQLPCPSLLHRGKLFEMKMSDIVKIPDQDLASENLMCWELRGCIG